MLRPLCSRERTPVFVEYEAGWAPRTSLDVSVRRKISCPHTAFQTPDDPTLSLVCCEVMRICTHTHTHTHTHFCNEDSFEDSKEYEESARFWHIHCLCVCVCVCVCLTVLQINTEKERVLKYTNVKKPDLKYLTLAQLEHRKACAEFYEASFIAMKCLDSVVVRYCWRALPVLWTSVRYCGRALPVFMNQCIAAPYWRWSIWCDKDMQLA